MGSNGDNYDRYLMRMEEMRQSDAIIRQCFAQMEPGEFIVKDFRYALPPKPLVYGTIEGLMAHFKLIMEGIKVPAGEAYSYTEARQRRARLLRRVRRRRPALQARPARAGLADAGGAARA